MTGNSDFSLGTTTPDVAAIVRRILALAAGADIGEITLGTRVADLGIDSIYAMAITTMLEIELDISVPLEVVIKLLSLTTVADVIGHARTLLPSQ